MWSNKVEKQVDQIPVMALFLGITKDLETRFQTFEKGLFLAKLKTSED